MRSSAALLLVSTLWVTTASAQPKDACITAYEQTQTLRNDMKFVAAHKQALACAKDSCPPILAKDCTRWAGELEGSTPSVMLEAQTKDGDPLTDVRVTVDGAAFTYAALTPIDPGKHVFHFEAHGVSYDETALLREGEKNRHIKATLAVERDGSSSRPVPTAFFVFGGISVVSLGVAVTFAADRDLDVKNGPFTVAGVALGAGVAAALTSIYLLIARP